MKKKTARSVVIKVNKPISAIISNWDEVEKLLFTTDFRPIVPHQFQTDDGSEYLRITPSRSGWVTPDDKYILTYIAGVLMDQGEKAESRVVSILSLDLALVEIGEALRRLNGLSMSASFVDGEHTITHGFSLLSGIVFVSEYRTLKEAGAKLSDWCFNTITCSSKAGTVF